MGKEQLRADITDHPGEYVDFVATKIGRIWSHGPRAIMRTPVWEALHWVLLGLGLLGLAILAYLRRWEALLIGAVFLAVTLDQRPPRRLPRRVLVLIPLLSACAGRRDRLDRRPRAAAGPSTAEAGRARRGSSVHVVVDPEREPDFGGRVGAAEEAAVLDDLRFLGAFAAS